MYYFTNPAGVVFAYDKLDHASDDMEQVSEDVSLLLANPPPSKEQQLIETNSIKQTLLVNASLAIAPLTYAVDLNAATKGEEAKLLSWKQYCVDLSRIAQQAEYPFKVEWPIQPE